MQLLESPSSLILRSSRLPVSSGKAAIRCRRYDANGPTALGDANPKSLRAPPVGSPRRPSRRSGGIIRSSAIGAPPNLRGRAREGRATHLENFQTALLGSAGDTDENRYTLTSGSGSLTDGSQPQRLATSTRLRLWLSSAYLTAPENN